MPPFVPPDIFMKKVEKCQNGLVFFKRFDNIKKRCFNRGDLNEDTDFLFQSVFLCR